MSALFRGSSTAAFDGLYRRHVSTVYRYTFAVLGNHADAEDVTQATFLNAYRALEQGVKPRKAENWLMTIAHNQLRQHFRAVRGKPLEVELNDALSRPQAEHGRDEPTAADVLRALQGLSPAQRSAIVMRELEGRSYSEIARIMGLTQSALEALIFRARGALAVQLEESLSCSEAEAAVSRRLDGRLGRREARRLRTHLKTCPTCARFENVQRVGRQALKGLSLIPVPASLFLFRGETAAAATGWSAATAGAGGAGVAGTGVAAALATGATAKVAAVTAAAALAGGVGYGVTASAPLSNDDRRAAHRQAVAETRTGARAAQVAEAKAQGERPGPAAPAAARAQGGAARAAVAKAAAARKHENRRAAPTAAEARAERERAAKPRPDTPAPKAARPVKPARAQPAATTRAAPSSRRSVIVETSVDEAPPLQRLRGADRARSKTK